MGDRYAVPRHGVIPGVVIQVLAAETLLAGPVPRQWSAVYPLLLALIFVAASLGIRSRRLGSAFFVVSTLGVLTLPLATEALFSISLPLAPRSEERRAGKECDSTCRSRWWPYH